jgi:hypothetical protein
MGNQTGFYTNKSNNNRAVGQAGYNSTGLMSQQFKSLTGKLSGLGIDD